MANPQQTNLGQPVTWLGALANGTDPRAQIIPNKTGFQEVLGKLGGLNAAYQNQFGWKAPDIAPAAARAQRDFREKTLPFLQGQFAQHGDQSALMRGIQGAGGDLQERLANLQYEKQFELQKLRQEQIPRMSEIAQQPQFQTHLTEKPINWEDADNPNNQRTLSGQIAASPIGQAGKQAAQNAAKNLGELGQRALTAGGKVKEGLKEKLLAPPRTQEQLQEAQMRQENAKLQNMTPAQIAKYNKQNAENKAKAQTQLAERQKAREEQEKARFAAMSPEQKAQESKRIERAKAKARADQIKESEIPLPFVDRVRKWVNQFEAWSQPPKPEAERPREDRTAEERAAEQKEFNVSNKLRQQAEKFRVPDNIIPHLNESDLPAFAYIAKRPSAQAELAKITSAGDVQKIASWYAANPAKREKIVDWMRSWVGKGPTKKYETNLPEAKIKEYATKFRLPASVTKQLTEEDIPGLEYLETRKRGSKEVSSKVKTIEDVRRITKYWQEHPAKREKIVDWFASWSKKKSYAPKEAK